MKKLILFLALFLASLQIPAQTKIKTELYLTGGYNINTSSFDGLGFVVDKYNSHISNQTKKLETPPYLHGISGGIGITYGNLFAEFLYVQKWSPVMSSEGTTYGNKSARDYKLQVNTYNIGVGFKFLKLKSLSFSLSASFDIVKLNQYTRAYLISGTVPDYYDVDLIASGTTNTMYAITFSPEAELRLPILGGFAFSAGPFYQLYLSKMNYAGTNEELNYSTYLTDPFESTKGSLNNFGFILKAKYYMSF